MPKENNRLDFLYRILSKIVFLLFTKS